MYSRLSRSRTARVTMSRGTRISISAQTRRETSPRPSNRIRCSSGVRTVLCIPCINSSFVTDWVSRGSVKSPSREEDGGLRCLGMFKRTHCVGKNSIYALTGAESTEPAILFSQQFFPSSRFDQAAFLKHVDSISPADGG